MGKARKYLGLTLLLTERYPLIHTLPEDDRARIKESLRKLRVEALAGDVDPGAKPIGHRWEGPISRDTASLAGTLARGAYRGVPQDLRARHKAQCPWALSVWPLTTQGDIIPCECGLTDRLEGPIAGKVSAKAWAHEEHLAQEDAIWARKNVQKDLSRLNARERRRLKRASK